MGNIAERLERIQQQLTETGDGEDYPLRPDFQDVVAALRSLTVVVADVARTCNARATE